MFSYWNCASGFIKKLPFLDDHFISFKPEVFFIAESDLLSNRNLSPLKRNGYQFCSSKTLEIRGKTRLSCWFSTKFTRAETLEFDLNEIIVLDSIDKDYSVVGVYHPFKCYQNETVRSNFERLIENLELVCRSRNHVIIVGDFNVHLTDATHCPLKLKLENFMNTFGLDQLISLPTRQRMVGNVLQSSLIDLVFTNIPGLTTSQDFNNASDHCIINIISDIFVDRPNLKKKVVEYLDWRRYDSSHACNLFSNMFKGINLFITDVDLINERITTALCLVLNKLVPKRKTTIRGDKSVINPKIQNLKNRKSRLYKKFTRTRDEDDFRNLTTISRKLNREIKYQRKLELSKKLKGNTKEYWDVINRVLGKGFSDRIEIDHNGTKTQDGTVLSNLFANFFLNKVMTLSENESDHIVLPDLSSLVNNEDGPNLYFSRLDVCEAIKKLKRSKAHGHDEIPGIVIKDLHDVLIDPLN